VQAPGSSCSVKAWSGSGSVYSGVAPARRLSRREMHVDHLPAAKFSNTRARPSAPAPARDARASVTLQAISHDGNEDGVIDAASAVE